MNKLFKKIGIAFVGIAMAVGVGVAVGNNSGDVKAAEAASDTLAMSALSSSDSNISAVAAKSTGQNAPITATVNSHDGVRMYANNTLTITSSQNITSLTIPWYKNGSKTFASVSVQSGGGTYTHASSSGNSGTWSGSSKEIVLKVGSSGQIQLYQIQYTTQAAKTLSSITLGGTYDTEFTVDDTFNHTGMTVTAHYSDSSTATVTGSATWSSPDMSTAGQKTVTVSYTEGGTTKTADYNITVSAPTTPSLSLDKASFSGYTGQSFSVTATYANLESDLAWSASGTGSISGGSITWSSDDHRNGTSTYSCTLSGEGGKTIVADADGVDAAQCVVTITQTTVNITKESTSIPKGKSETLAASHNASSVGGLNWTSSNDSVAAVNSDGKVTVAAGATVGTTVTITARSSVDTSVSDTCTVTVAEAPIEATYDFVTNFSSFNDGWTNSYGEHTGINGKTQVGGAYAATIDLYYASKQGSTITDRPVFASKTASGSWTKVIGFTLTEANYKIKDVEVTFSQWTTKTPDVALFSGDEATGTPLDSGTIGTKNTISTTGLNDTEFTVGYCDKNTGSNVQAGLTSITITLEKENVLDHVTVSFASDPADRTFSAGSTFAFNGTLTASYTADSPKTVTPTGYFIEGEEGEGDPITTSDILTVADHNGADIYVQYKEGGVTKYDTFTLIVNPAPATSVTLSANSGSVALEEIFTVSSITATVNPQAYATQGVTWEVYDSGGLVEDVTYMYDGTQFYATEEADVVFHVKSTATPSVYASFTLSITGNPIAHLKDEGDHDVTSGSMTVFADADVISYSVTTENFQGTMTYTWSSSNTSIISVKEDVDDMCDYQVNAAGSSRLSCRIQGSVKGDVTVYVDVTVTAVTVTSVSWSAPTINVYSNASLSSTSGWNVKYRTNSDPEHDKVADSFKIMLGGSEISLPYPWSASDDNKTLCVQVGGVNSSTTTVSVTQALRPIMASNTNTWDHTFTAKAWSAKGDWTISEKLWNMSGTDDDSPYFGYDATKGQQFGSGSHPFSDVSLQSSAFSGTIDSVTVYTSGANNINATVQVSVGGTAYGSAKTITATNTSYTFNLGGKSGTISIDWVNSSSKAIYVKEIVVNTVTSSEDIANVAGHEAAQRAVVKFAKAFNTALGATENCTTGLDGAWSTASSAWDTFLTEAADLGETEEAYAKRMIKSATAQWTANTDNNFEYCLERAMATYEKCVKYHDKTAFMSEVRPVVKSNYVSPLGVVAANSNTVIIIAIVSVITTAAIGGYFFLRKRKED